jgi:hypothetical protein
MTRDLTPDQLVWLRTHVKAFAPAEKDVMQRDESAMQSNLLAGRVYPGEARDLVCNETRSTVTALSAPAQAAAFRKDRTARTRCARMTLSVGQKLWYVPYERRGKPCEVVVKTIGRKWAGIDSGLDRVDMKTLIVDGAGYSSPGRCYLSRAEWEADVALEVAWGALWRDVHAASYRCPDGVTVENIQAARKLLRIDPPDARESGAESRTAPSHRNADDADVKE